MTFAPQVTAAPVTTPAQVTTSAPFTPTANGLQIVGGGVTGPLASQNSIAVSSTHAGQGAWTVIQWTTTGASQCSAFIAVSKTGPNPGSGTVSVTLGAAPVGESWFPSEIPDGFDPNNIAVGAVSAGAGNTATTPTLTLTTAPAAADIVLATFASRNDPNLVTPGPGFTAVGQANGTANPRVSVLREWDTGTTSPTVTAASMGTVYNAGVAFIVRAAPASTTPHNGTATTSWTATATASGSRPPAVTHTGTASTSWTATATASGSRPPAITHNGTATTSWTATATASGSRPPAITHNGTASASWTATATASGSRPPVVTHNGTATTSWTATATASGSSPAIGVNAGTATTSWTATASATGSRPPAVTHNGTASTSWTATASATGSLPASATHNGTATTSWTATASATGSSASVIEGPLVTFPQAVLTVTKTQAALTPTHTSGVVTPTSTSGVVTPTSTSASVALNTASGLVSSILTSGVVTPNGYTAQWRFVHMSQWKTGDTWPPLEVSLLDAGQPVDLTNATAIKIHVAPAPPATITINAPMEVVGDPTLGVVRYVWAAGDLNEAGTFRLEVEVTWATGEIQTFPPASYLSYTVTDELDTGA